MSTTWGDSIQLAASWLNSGYIPKSANTAVQCDAKTTRQLLIMLA